MTTQEKDLEKRILSILETRSDSIVRVVSKLLTEDPKLSESLARRIIWRMVDRGQLYETPVRNLVVTGKQTSSDPNAGHTVVYNEKDTIEEARRLVNEALELEHELSLYGVEVHRILVQLKRILG